MAKIPQHATFTSRHKFARLEVDMKCKRLYVVSITCNHITLIVIEFVFSDSSVTPPINCWGHQTPQNTNEYILLHEVLLISNELLLQVAMTICQMTISEQCIARSNTTTEKYHMNLHLPRF